MTYYQLSTNQLLMTVINICRQSLNIIKCNSMFVKQMDIHDKRRLGKHIQFNTHLTDGTQSRATSPQQPPSAWQTHQLPPIVLESLGDGVVSHTSWVGGPELVALA